MTFNVSDGNDPNSREEEWNTNKAKWDTFLSAGINPPPHHHGYEMVFQQNSGVIEYNLPYRVKVNKDGVVSHVKQMDGTPVSDSFIIGRMKTVDQSFTLIKDAWSYAVNVTAMYHATAGYPTFVFIDKSIDIVDEEILFTIKDVTLR